MRKKKSSVSGCNKSGIIETLELHIITKRNNRNNNRLSYALNHQLLDTMALYRCNESASVYKLARKSELINTGCDREKQPLCDFC